jgi:Sulfatase
VTAGFDAPMVHGFGRGRFAAGCNCCTQYVVPMHTLCGILRCVSQCARKIAGCRRARAQGAFNAWHSCFEARLVRSRTDPPDSSICARSQRKDNILIIWGDDIGYWNVSTYNHGMMGYKTPNIDRIAREGAYFTDWYGQQSCTAGRASFITGQVGFRTGLLKIGLPGAKEGLQARDVTIAQFAQGTGLCDRSVRQEPSW